MKTTELSGAALNWAVSMAVGEYVPVAVPAYSTDWSWGGPIIERECICIARLDPKTEDDTNFWVAHIDGIYCRYGLSALTAAMRCYVASKLGDEIELPETLK
jgi:hypothetical protein